MSDAAVPAPPADDEPTTVSIFNEQSLRAAIASVWGEHGAHVVLFDHLLGRAGVSPQPEITRQQIANAIGSAAGPATELRPEDWRKVITPDRAADAVWALLADGATPAGPDGPERAARMIAEVQAEHARTWPSCATDHGGVTPAEDDQ